MDTAIRIIADGLMLPLVLIAAYALLRRVPKSERYDRYTRIVMAGITAYFFAKIIGFLWQPDARRPFEILGVEPGASYLNNPGFPSDHVLFAMFLTLAVWYGTRSKKLALILGVLTVLVGVGRMLALVHSPLDVVGGTVIATLGAVWYVTPRQKMPKPRLAKNTNK